MSILGEPREWVSVVAAPGQGVKVKVTLKQGDYSASWTLKAYHGEKLEPHLNAARANARKALEEVLHTEP
jgi:hypothetical protein